MRNYGINQIIQMHADDVRQKFFERLFNLEVEQEIEIPYNPSDLALALENFFLFYSVKKGIASCTEGKICYNLYCNGEVYGFCNTSFTWGFKEDHLISGIINVSTRISPFSTLQERDIKSITIKLISKEIMRIPPEVAHARENAYLKEVYQKYVTGKK